MSNAKFSRNRNQAKERLNRFVTRRGLVVRTLPPGTSADRLVPSICVSIARRRFGAGVVLATPSRQETIALSERLPPCATVCVNRWRLRAGFTWATPARNEAIPIPDRLPPRATICINRWRLRAGSWQVVFRRDDTLPPPQRIPAASTVCVFRTPPSWTAQSRWVRGGRTGPRSVQRTIVATRGSWRRRKWFGQTTGARRSATPGAAQAKKQFLRMHGCGRVELSMHWRSGLNLWLQDP